MKKLFLAVVGIIALSSFTNVDSEKILMHNCTYRLYSNGQYVGNITMTYPDFCECDSLMGRNTAIYEFNN